MYTFSYCYRKYYEKCIILNLIDPAYESVNLIKNIISDKGDTIFMLRYIKLIFRSKAQKILERMI